MERSCLSQIYIYPLTTLEWICNPIRGRSSSSIIWRAITQSISIIRRGLAWCISNGEVVCIGKDAWSGCGNVHILSLELRQSLEAAGITQLSQITDEENSTWLSQAWKSAQDLMIPNIWRNEWIIYIGALEDSYVRITDREDDIIWAASPRGRYTPKDGYTFLITEQEPVVAEWWWRPLCKLKALPKSRIFMWCLLSNRVPTDDNLNWRFIHDPSWCNLYKEHVEDIDHLFLLCPAIKQVWN